MNYYRCGKILTTHGIQGDVKVQNYSDFDRFHKGATLYIKHGKDYVMVKVCKVSEYGNGYLCRFEGMEDINLVEKYHSDEIFVSELERQDELEEGEYYYSDLIGKKVTNEQGEARGTVEDMRELPQAHYLVVNYQGKSCLIPFMKQFIADVTEDTIIVREIEGLF